MLEDGSNRPRNVVPRWRSLKKTPDHETRPLLTSKSCPAYSESFLTDALSRWKSSENLENASDVIDAALTFEKYDVAQDAASFILSNNVSPVKGLRQAAEYVTNSINGNTTKETETGIYDSKNAISQNIKCLKLRLSDSPRDAITCLEIGRLQSLIGQIESAKKFVDRASRQEPNNRYIIRSTTRFFVHIEEPDRALESIYRSDAVKVDPWIQAAEVAACDLSNKSPRWAIRQLRSLISQKQLGIEYSELAAGLATLEHKNGAQRRFVSRLLSGSLQNPTENALAQAVWINERADTKAETADLIVRMSSAHEARVLSAYEQGKGEVGAKEAWLWLTDQPLSLAPALAGSYFTGTLLSQYRTSLRFLEVASLAHPNHPSLINNKIVAYSYLGEIDQAQIQLNLLQRYAHSDTVIPFIHAARGLIAFRRGDVIQGRDHYRKSFDITSKTDPRLACYAAMYWLEQEIYCGGLQAEDAKRLIAEFETRFQNSSKSYRRFVLHVWKNRRPMMEQFIDNKNNNRRIIAYSGVGPSIGLPSVDLDIIKNRLN